MGALNHGKSALRVSEIFFIYYVHPVYFEPCFMLGHFGACFEGSSLSRVPPIRHGWASYVEGCALQRLEPSTRRKPTLSPPNGLTVEPKTEAEAT